MPYSISVDDYFDMQEHWLSLEGEAERERLATRRSVMSRDRAETRGETLIRMELVEQETGLGGRLLLEFAKAGRTHLPMTRLKTGSPVVITDDRNQSDAGIPGVVSRRRSHGIQIATERWPEGDWFRIDLSPDETTRRRQLAAIAAMRTAKGRSRQLRDMIMGSRPIGEPRSSSPKNTPSEKNTASQKNAANAIQWMTSLNPPQQDAVRFALDSPDIGIIHGPPGTGKTTTLAEIIYQSVKRGHRVLACAPSNTAVDNLLERLVQVMPNVVRVGHPARVFEGLRDHTLDQRVDDDPTADVIEDMRRELQYLMRAASKDYRSRDGRRRRGEMYAEAGRLRSQIRTMERSVVKSVLDSADVICTTTTIDDDLLGDRQFDLVVVDEACQCTLPGIWQAVMRADRMVLAGDHLQLPPTVLSDVARREGLGESLMQRLVAREGDSIFHRLTVQYRMNESIMRFSSNEFYEGSLVADRSVRKHRLCDLPDVESNPSTEAVVEFWDTAGAEYEEQIEKEGLSKFNPKEGQVVLAKTKELMDAGVAEDQIAIIAPYGAQVRWLRNRMDSKLVEIDTVDGFQGREKEVVILTMVRSNDRGEIGFLSETRRTNVAMTRARRKLMIIGDSSTLGRHEFYDSMFRYIDENGNYRSVWELGW